MGSSVMRRSVHRLDRAIATCPSCGPIQPVHGPTHDGRAHFN